MKKTLIAIIYSVLFFSIASIVASSEIFASTYPVQITTNITYGPKPYEQLDQCIPVGSSTARPGIIAIHGGGWSSGDKSYYEAMCSNYASEGYVFTTINYRLATQYQWTDQIGDVQLAVRFMRATASQTNLDPSRICALGDSAGAHLALLLDSEQTVHPADVANMYSPFSPQVHCIVDQFGPTDMTKLYNENPSVQQTISNLLQYQTPQSDPAIYADASPVQYISSHTGQALIIQGTRDQTVLPDQSIELQQDLQNNNVPVQVITYSGGHEYSGLTQQQITAIKTQVNQFLNTILHP